MSGEKREHGKGASAMKKVIRHFPLYTLATTADRIAASKDIRTYCGLQLPPDRNRIAWDDSGLPPRPADICQRCWRLAYGRT